MGEAPTQSLITHTGYPVERIEQVACDAEGNLWLLTEHGPGCIDDRDLGALELDLDESAISTPTAGHLTLQGHHTVHRLQASPDTVLGFDRKPRY
jgi:hypothetical protein